jgi:hypothetical protein
LQGIRAGLDARCLQAHAHFLRYRHKVCR